MTNKVTLESGTGPGSKLGTEQIIDALRGALRFSLSPVDHSDVNNNQLGFYRVAGATGTTVSIGAAGILSYLRWSDTSRFLALLRVQVGAYIAATITTAAAVDCALTVSRGSTAAGSGGAALAVSAGMQKMRKSMGDSLVTDCRIATTAALTRPTGGVLDTNPMIVLPMKASFNIQNPGTATFVNGHVDSLVDIYRWDPVDHPLILHPGDTAEVQEFTAGPTTGGIRWYVNYSFAELAVF